MIFQPGAGGSGGGLKAYKGTISNTVPATFETSVKIAFVTMPNKNHLYNAVVPGESVRMCAILNGTVIEQPVDVSLSEDGKTLSCNLAGNYLYYALG